jgi:hypothetical protein
MEQKPAANARFANSAMAPAHLHSGRAAADHDEIHAPMITTHGELAWMEVMLRLPSLCRQ